MRRAVHYLLMMLAATFLSGMAVDARAASSAANCILATDDLLDSAEAAASSNWVCDAAKLDAVGDHSWVRIPAEALHVEEPVLIGDAMASSGLIIGRAKSDGRMASRAMSSAALAKNWTTGTRFALPLHSLGGEGPLFVRVDRPLGPDLAHGLKVVSTEAAERDRTGSLVLLGVVLGMLILTAIVSGFMAIALRRWFAAVHFAFSVLLVIYVTTAGSLIFLIAPGISLWTRSVISYATLAWAIALLAPFALTFFERDAITPAMRRVAIACGLLVFAGGFLLPLGALLGVSMRAAYNLCFIPGSIATLVITTSAWRKGSEAARVFVMAWSVPFVFSIERLVRNLGLYSLPPIADFGFYLSLAFEAAALMAAVGWRVKALREERDAALAVSDDLAREARHDALTGLGNRRDYDARVWQAGDMLGLIDIDRFKSVNDTYGHATGDRVLEWLGDMLRREVATGSFVGAWRLGGEEFAVVVRAASVELAALELDRVRRGIPLAIDNEVPGLDHPITASAGLAKVDPADPKASYREADLLLYNAKRSGRDQLCFDRRDPLRETRDAAPLLGPQLNLSRKVS